LRPLSFGQENNAAAVALGAGRLTFDDVKLKLEMLAAVVGKVTDAALREPDGRLVGVAVVRFPFVDDGLKLGLPAVTDSEDADVALGEPDEELVEIDPFEVATVPLDVQRLKVAFLAVIDAKEADVALNDPDWSVVDAETERIGLGDAKLKLEIPVVSEDKLRVVPFSVLDGRVVDERRPERLVDPLENVESPPSAVGVALYIPV
jgi:hypothetical protein